MGKMDLIQEMPKKLGFGCMRLPLLSEKTEDIDYDTFCQMIDHYMEKGFKYFDTAYPYHNEMSEGAVKKCIVDRYPRESFYLADKMPVWMIKSEEDYGPIFEKQLERTGAGYFDFYLLHALNQERIDFLEKTGGFEFVKRMKEEGKVKNIGFSFHDSAEVLENALKKHLELDFIQLQINYFDWDSENVQSGKCYAVAEKYSMPVIVMEPVKGGTLANLIGEPKEILADLDKDASHASFAIRFAASLPNVMVVLSGMSDFAQLEDNTSYMENFNTLTSEEKAGIEAVNAALKKMESIGCTKCRYCVEGCPKKIMIPSVFAVRNMAYQFGITASTKNQYKRVTDPEDGRGKASDCIKCGKCEKACPQHLEIRALLEEVAGSLEGV